MRKSLPKSFENLSRTSDSFRTGFVRLGLTKPRQPARQALMHIGVIERDMRDCLLHPCNCFCKSAVYPLLIKSRD